MRTKQQAWYGTGIGDLAFALLQKGWPDHEILKAIVAEFPGCGTKIASIRWYRSKARGEGLPVPLNREAEVEWPRRKQLLWGLRYNPLDDMPAKYGTDPEQP